MPSAAGGPEAILHRTRNAYYGAKVSGGCRVHLLKSSANWRGIGSSTHWPCPMMLALLTCGMHVRYLIRKALDAVNTSKALVNPACRREIANQDDRNSAEVALAIHDLVHADSASSIAFAWITSHRNATEDNIAENMWGGNAT